MPRLDELLHGHWIAPGATAEGYIKQMDSCDHDLTHDELAAVIIELLKAQNVVLVRSNAGLEFQRDR